MSLGFTQPTLFTTAPAMTQQQPYRLQANRRRSKTKKLIGTALFLATFATATSLATIAVMQKFHRRPLPTLSPLSVSTIKPPSQQVTHHLLRQTLRQLSLANVTNTYRQFRSLAAPSFQHANSSEKLRDIFTWMRTRQIEISPDGLLARSELSHLGIDKKGFLNVAAVVHSQPGPISIRVAYKNINHRWALFGIHVSLLKTPVFETPVFKTPALKTPGFDRPQRHSLLSR